MARLEGIEPPTYGLEIRCSIQLSYRRSAATGSAPGSRDRAAGKTRCGAARTALRGPVQPPAAGRSWSGREDLNLRHPAPKAGALPGCATPRHRVCKTAGEDSDAPGAASMRRQRALRVFAEVARAWNGFYAQS